MSFPTVQANLWGIFHQSFPNYTFSSTFSFTTHHIYKSPKDFCCQCWNEVMYIFNILFHFTSGIPSLSLFWEIRNQRIFPLFFPIYLLVCNLVNGSKHELFPKLILPELSFLLLKPTCSTILRLHCLFFHITRSSRQVYNHQVLA